MRQVERLFIFTISLICRFFIVNLLLGYRRPNEAILPLVIDMRGETMKKTLMMAGGASLAPRRWSCPAPAIEARTFALGTLPTAAAAAPYTFNLVGNTAASGPAGDAIAFNTTIPSTLDLSATGWQANLLTNSVSSAYLGDSAGGLGISAAGSVGLGFFTDFVLLEFDRPVTLTSVTTNSTGAGGLSAYSAIWFGASSAVTPAWNSTVGFAGSAVAPSPWGAAAGTGATRLTGATAASTKWLVGTAFGSQSSQMDGFRLSSITDADQVAAVPEPASWLTMILGFGAAGAVLRRRRGAGRLASALA